MWQVLLTLRPWARRKLSDILQVVKGNPPARGHELPGNHQRQSRIEKLPYKPKHSCTTHSTEGSSGPGNWPQIGGDEEHNQSGDVGESSTWPDAVDLASLSAGQGEKVAAGTIGDSHGWLLVSGLVFTGCWDGSVQHFSTLALLTFSPQFVYCGKLYKT